MVFFLPFSSIRDTFLPSPSNNKVTQIDIQGQNCQGHYP